MNSTACFSAVLLWLAAWAEAAAVLRQRDASTLMSGGTNNEGEAHGPIKAPSGSDFVTFPVGDGGEHVAAYWTQNPNDDQATQAYIMIHGKLRDGDAYWTTMNNVLQNALQNNVDGVDQNAIVVAPEFFSARYNSGQYDNETLAWDDVNGWQAGDVAVVPNGTKLTSFDALDALVDGFLDQSKYPAMNRVVVVGHGGGGQLAQRYATVAEPPANNTRVRIRYIHGDPSSCSYFTTDRPTIDGETLPSKSDCGWYNTWRYGFDNFTGTAIGGLKTPEQYFAQYTSRDVVSIVGYEDVDSSGDEYCMAQMQGGSRRRDRNLIWWQYINLLAKTGEDLNGFPGSFDESALPDWSNATTGKIFGVRLLVVEDAGHDAEAVFESDEGRAALFAVDSVLPTGWRPDGWQNTTNAVLPPPFAATATIIANATGTGSNDTSSSPSPTPEEEQKGAAASLILSSWTIYSSALLILLSASLLVS